MCGFEKLHEREDRLSRANEIINSKELKQAICNQILGCTFKDIERAMDAVLNERQLTPLQEEELDLQLQAPQKFDPELEFKLNKKASAKVKKTSPYREYTREEVAQLIAASNAPFDPPPEREPIHYPTYSREQVQELVRQHYEYLDEEKRRKEERAKWDSSKTTEFEPKTENTKKPLISTKD